VWETPAEDRRCRRPFIRSIWRSTVIRFVAAAATPSPRILLPGLNRKLAIQELGDGFETAAAR